MIYITNSLFLIFILLFSTSLEAQTGWFSVPPPGSNNFYATYFIDANVGIAGNFKTTNSGVSWTQVLAYSGYGLHFVNSSIGYCVSSGILKTTNAGNNWTIQNSPSTSVKFAVYFTEINTGYCAAEFAEINKTTDGGENWMSIPNGVSVVYRFHDLYFVDANTGYVCGMEQNDFTSVILKTVNGGANWTRQDFPNGTGFVSIFFTNPGTGIVAGLNVYKTTDGGNTWLQKQMPFQGYFKALEFTSQSTGYALSANRIVKTTTGGEDWFEQASNTSAFLEDISFANDHTGFICGWNGKILKTTDGGGPPIGITPLGKEVPREYELAQNYPNPFNPSTNIRFSIPEKSFVKIIIYDVSGRLEDELVNIDLNAGSYEVAWNASGLSSGAYFCTLIAGNYRESKKMLLLK
jgi:photosystem II stability/assembly factor-like uncharacterized protein